MLEQLVSDYGYLAILVGCFLEGETILVLGGFAAHRGYLELDHVVLAAFVGSFAGDQLYFYIGRRWGEYALARRPAWRPGAERARRLLERYGTVFILSFRFIYGVRTISAFVIGLAGIGAWRFLVLNAISAAIWSVVIGGAGYAFGEAITRMIDRVKVYELHVVAAVVALSVAGWAVHVLRRRWQARRYYADWRNRPTDTD